MTGKEVVMSDRAISEKIFRERKIINSVVRTSLFNAFLF
jgi:hypothetical protein